MIVLAVELDLLLFDAHSLKEKRKIVRSIIDKIHHHFKLSAAEVDRQDSLDAAVIGVAVVTNEMKQAERVLDQVESAIERDYPVEMTNKRYYHAYG